MPFNSLRYLTFLPLVWLAFQAVPQRGRWLVLLLASLGFYTALKAPYLIVALVMVAGVTHVVGGRLGALREQDGGRSVLWVGIASNLLVLFLLKYLPLFSASGLPFPSNSTWISIGVSYFVFQAISYLVDVYLEVIEPEPHFGYLLLSLAFFPKLLQGPIERSGDLLPQLRAPYRFSFDNMRSGMLLFVLGLMKKTVLADRLGLFVDFAYGNVHAYTGLPLILATYFYAFQLYFDFSGYTDMALGAARFFNISLTQNFNRPYLATSVADFWRRWHISFSRWILDYIFKPLQMLWRDRRSAGTALALLATFALSGLWHGASWGFIVWGLLHGLYLALSVLTKPLRERTLKALGGGRGVALNCLNTIVTFNLVAFAWIFFRAEKFSDAMYVVRHLFVGVIPFLATVLHNITSLNSGRGILDPLLMGQSRQEFLVALGSVVVMVMLEIRGTAAWEEAVFRWPLPLRWSAYYLLLGLIIIGGVFGPTQHFVYFKF